MSQSPKRQTRATTCPNCNATWQTRANGYSVTCTECDHAHYVPRDDAAPAPLAARPLRAVTCNPCGFAFTTRAKVQSATKCPECRASVWVPLSAPIELAEVAPPAPREAVRRQPPRRDSEPLPSHYAPAVSPLAALLAGYGLPRFGTPPPAASSTQPSTTAPAPRPAPSTGSPWPSLPRPAGTRSAAGRREPARIYNMPLWPAATRQPDRCWLESGIREGEQCRGRAELDATIAGRVFRVCEGHGQAIERGAALRQVPPLS
jgi:hypothetical protein